MIELLLSVLATAILTVVLGLFTTWAFWLCLLVAVLVVVFGIIFIHVGGDGDGDWL